MTRGDLLQLLDNRGIAYEITEHVPVFTIEEMLKANLPYPSLIAKNLFVRDDKKRNYYLITVKEERVINLKEFQAKFGTRKLSFASESDLMDILVLVRGSVTPFGLLNDHNHKVHLFIDASFEKMGIHPLENTATVWINKSDLVKLISDQGTEITEF